MNFIGLTPLLSTLKPSEQIILINLFSRAVNYEVQASQANLISWTGIKSRNTIKAALRTLIDRGLIKVTKLGQENSSSLFELCISGTAPAAPTISETVTKLNPDGQLRLAAIKKSLSPTTWNEIKTESEIMGHSIDQLLIKKYFGPGRLV